MKIHVQLPSGYSTLKWALEFGITVKNRSCACIGRISGLHFCTSFTLRGQSVPAQLGGWGVWWWMTRRGPFPYPHVPKPREHLRERDSPRQQQQQAQHFLGSACQRLSLGDTGCPVSPGRWRACTELWRGRELGQKGCWDCNAQGKPQLKLMEGTAFAACLGPGGAMLVVCDCWRCTCSSQGHWSRGPLKVPSKILIVMYSSVVCICFPSVLSLIYPYLSSQLTTLCCCKPGTIIHFFH